MEEEFKTVALDFYESEYKKFFPNNLKLFGEVIIDLDALKGVKRDISLFEEHECDIKDTYVTLTYREKDDSYDVDIHLACEK